MADMKEQVSLTGKYAARLDREYVNRKMKPDGERANSISGMIRERVSRYQDYIRKNAVVCGDREIGDRIVELSGTCDVLVIGELHSISRHRDIIRGCMDRLKEKGVKAICMEYLSSDLQESVDRFDGQDARAIREYLEKAWGLYSEKTAESMMRLIFEAKRQDIRVIGMDSRFDPKERASADQREAHMFSILEKNLGRGRVMVLCGNEHSINAKAMFRNRANMRNVEVNGTETERNTSEIMVRSIKRSGMGGKGFILGMDGLGDPGLPDHIVHFAEEEG